jgi:hypothetical protein
VVGAVRPAITHGDEPTVKVACSTEGYNLLSTVPAPPDVVASFRAARAASPSAPSIAARSSSTDGCIPSNPPHEAEVVELAKKGEPTNGLLVVGDDRYPSLSSDMMSGIPLEGSFPAVSNSRVGSGRVEVLFAGAGNIMLKGRPTPHSAVPRNEGTKAS